MANGTKSKLDAEPCLKPGSRTQGSATMAETGWFYILSGKRQGPVTNEQLADLIATGSIPANICVETEARCLDDSRCRQRVSIEPSPSCLRRPC